MSKVMDARRGMATAIGPGELFAQFLKDTIDLAG
jgi:hypothetical protein